MPDRAPLLTGPYGFGSGDSVTLSREAAEPDEAWSMALVAVLHGYACHPPAIPKVVACLRASGRYDCVLQSTWFRKNYTRLSADLHSLGIAIAVTRPNPVNREAFK